MNRAAALCLLLLGGCVYHRPATVSTTALGPSEKPLRLATGRVDSFQILFFGPFGDDSLSAALDKAMRGTDADTMVNVFVDRKETYVPFPSLPLLVFTTTEITGTLVKYDAASFDRDPIKPRRLRLSRSSIGEFLDTLPGECALQVVTIKKKFVGHFQKHAGNILTMTDGLDTVRINDGEIQELTTFTNNGTTIVVVE